MNESAAPPPRLRANPAAATAAVDYGARSGISAGRALEILETPPAPLPVALMADDLRLRAAALVWSFFGRLDVHAVGAGQDRDRRPRQGDPTARSRQDRRHSRRERQP